MEGRVLCAGGGSVGGPGGVGRLLESGGCLGWWRGSLDQACVSLEWVV